VGDETKGKSPYLPPTKGELIAAAKELRRKLGDTQPEFAMRVGVSIRTVAHWEKNRPPRGMILFKLLEVAGKVAKDDALRSVFRRAVTGQAEDTPSIRDMLTTLFDAPRPSLSILHPRWERRFISAEEYLAEAREEVDREWEAGKSSERAGNREEADREWEETKKLSAQARARSRELSEELIRVSRVWDDLGPLMAAAENPDEYADELTAWRIIRREIERKSAESQPKADGEK